MKNNEKNTTETKNLDYYINLVITVFAFVIAFTLGFLFVSIAAFISLFFPNDAGDH